MKAWWQADESHTLVEQMLMHEVSFEAGNLANVALHHGAPGQVEVMPRQRK